jgi:hypothetical protein
VSVQTNGDSNDSDNNKEDSKGDSKTEGGAGGAQDEKAIIEYQSPVRYPGMVLTDAVRLSGLLAWKDKPYEEVKRALTNTISLLKQEGLKQGGGGAGGAAGGDTKTAATRINSIWAEPLAQHVDFAKLLIEDFGFKQWANPAYLSSTGVLAYLWIGEADSDNIVTVPSAEILLDIIVAGVATSGPVRVARISDVKMGHDETIQDSASLAVLQVPPFSFPFFLPFSSLSAPR